MALKNKTLGKRKATISQRSSKKAKLLSTEPKRKEKGKTKGKEHGYDKPFIPIPRDTSTLSGSVLSEEELEFFGGDVETAHGFLVNLDEKGIARSKKEQERLHRLTKPQHRTTARGDDLPSIDSHSEDDGSWSSGIEDDNSEGISITDNEISSSSSSPAHENKSKPSRQISDDEEMSYEMIPRKRRKSWDSNDDEEGIARLPIKLQNGQILRSGQKIILRDQERDEESYSEEAASDEEVPAREDVSTGARFGRPAVVDVISTRSRRARIQAAKEQIASICQDIVADPENSIGLLRRLYTFCLPQISTASHPDLVPNDTLIRKLALLSQLAVYKDIIPGYRIRPLTDKERTEKVSQIVQRTRDFEQGLVSVYQAYLRVLEDELKANSELAETALQCICRLLADLTHFNFRVNLMTAVVARLSRKKWDESSDLCLNTLSSVFRTDSLGQASLEIVRLLNRMIKERHFNIHPNVMSCLLDLRLKTELGGVRASQTKADKETQAYEMARGKAASRGAKRKPTGQPYLSKKARKKLKEVEDIQKEMREANAEVDREERAAMQTETLKLLFVLYFRILKSDKPTPLFPAALQGISRFAHLVNIDFFKDLLQVLRDHVFRLRKFNEGKNGVEKEEDSVTSESREVHRRLHCIVTAFDLLSGQGEALNIDLTDFVNALYGMLIPLSLIPGIEKPVVGTRAPRVSRPDSRCDTPANMLFHALDLVFFPRSVAATSPPWRSAAFAKRLLTSSLHFPGSTAVHALQFVLSLFAKESKLDALLSVEDRVANGVYRPDIDDPQLCNPFATNLWELQILSERHGDQEVRRLARELLHYSRDQR